MVSYSDLSAPGSPDINQSWPLYCGLEIADCSEIPGTLWPPTGTLPDLNDYWINNGISTNDLSAYLPNGTYFIIHSNPIINVTFTDNFLTTLTASATIPIVAPPIIADIDLNTRCAPGYGPVNPQFTTLVYGGTPFSSSYATAYNYSWTPVSAISFSGVFTAPADAILNSYTIPDPTITGLRYAHGAPILTADYIFTATDAKGCQSSMQVKTNLITSGYDLASRDSWFDLYNEPNDQGINAVNAGNIWASPDIWNRLTNDGLTYNYNQPPTYYQPIGSGPQPPNYLCVRIRNVGCSEYTNVRSTPGTLSTYWTIGGGSETWNSYWLNTTSGGAPFPACDGSIQNYGDQIGTTTACPASRFNDSKSPGPLLGSLS